MVQQDSSSDPNEGAVPPLRLRLYVAGLSPNSTTAAATLRALRLEFSSRAIELETIDVLREPQRALPDRVFQTPMLIKIAPLPERRIVGNLSERRMLLAALGLEEA